MFFRAENTMNRPYRPTPPKPAPVHLSALMDRVLVGAFAALVVARLLVAGDDAGRLRLTDSGGPISFNLCLLFVFIGFAVWRIIAGRGRPFGWAIVPVLLAAIGVTAYVSSQLPDRYARPGLFIAWEWVGLAVAYYLARRLTASVADSRGLLNALLASAVSIAGLGLYQAAADKLGLPTTDIVIPPNSAPLAGDDEFYPELNRPADLPAQPRGTFDSPETLFIFLILVLPAALAVAKARRTSAWGKWAVAVPLAMIAAAATTLLLHPFGEHGGHWGLTLEQVASHPLFGVGPGNLSRELNGAPGADGAWIALAATTGLVGIGLLAAALIVAILRARPSSAPDPFEPPLAGTRWEFYYGGVVGLLIGFVWAFGAMPAEAPADEVFRLGATAVLRAALWFASFALLETIRPARASIGRAALIGTALVLAYGIVSDAPGRPTVLFPLFVLLAIGSNLRQPEGPALAEGGWTKPVRVVGLITACGLAVLFLVTAAVPAWETAAAVRQARMASRLYPDLHREIDRARPGAERATSLTKARGFLLQNILTPLREAAERDSTNSALLLELSRWRRPLWEYQLTADPEGAARVAEDTLRAADRAGKLDPHNPAAQRSLFEALALFRKNSSTRAAERIAQMNKRIELIAQREPELEVPLRYRVVQMLLELREKDDVVRPEVTRLLELNRQGGHGHLTDKEKTDMIEKVKEVMHDVPAAVLDEWTK
jgi:hypothetical protein